MYLCVVQLYLQIHACIKCKQMSDKNCKIYLLLIITEFVIK